MAARTPRPSRTRFAWPAASRSIASTKRSRPRSPTCTRASTTAACSLRSSALFVVRADRLLRRRRIPQLENPQEGMPEDFVAEEILVLPFHLRHSQQAINHLLMPCIERVGGSIFVFHNISAL